MDFNLENIKVIPAEKNNDSHKKTIWKIFNENLEFNLITSKAVSYEQHCKWWENAFDSEYIYVIIYENLICGYIRLTKVRTSTKELNEISVALDKKYQNYGIGTYACSIFENIIRKLGIKQIIALTHYENNNGKKFFEKNNFKKSYIRYQKEL